MGPKRILIILWAVVFRSCSSGSAGENVNAVSAIAGSAWVPDAFETVNRLAK